MWHITLRNGKYMPGRVLWSKLIMCDKDWYKEGIS